VTGSVYLDVSSVRTRGHKVCCGTACAWAARQGLLGAARGSWAGHIEPSELR